MFKPFFPLFIHNDKLATSFVVSPNRFSLDIDFLRSVRSKIAEYLVSMDTVDPRMMGNYPTFPQRRTAGQTGAGKDRG